MNNIEVKEVACKSLLNPSKINEFKYCINLYTGCSHGCVYCYARFMCKYIDKDFNEWGKFVHVKINGPEILAEQIKTKTPGMVMVCSVTDAYQPIEAKYKVTRKEMEILGDNNFPVGLLTKSTLVTRDIDIFKEMKGSGFGFTITCFDDEDCKNWEPNASVTSERIKALEKMSNEGLSTYVFLGPFLPYISGKELDYFIETLAKTGIDTLYLDKLNIKGGNWKPIIETIEKHYPELKEKYNAALFSKTSTYYSEIRKRVEKLANENKIKLVNVFR